MSQRSHLSVVRTDDAPPPLLPVGLDLGDLPSFMVDVDWVTNPRFWAKVPRDAKMAAVELQVASTMESPAGSLPSDDEGLALAAGLLSDVEAWRRVADIALRGWTLCSDGRYYRADVAKKMLHVWIVRLADRRRGAASQAKRRKEDFDARQYDADLAVAVACMTRLDPYAPILRNYRNSQTDIDPVVAEPGQQDAADSRTNSRSNSRSTNKVSEAKRSQANLSPDLRSGDSPDHQDEGEIGDRGGGSVNRTPQATKGRERAPPWPPDWFETFRALYPKREMLGQAEKVLERIRKAGKVPFEEIIAGVKRLVARIDRGELPPHLACRPGKWLEGRGWEDEPDTRSPVFGKTEILPPTRGSPGPSVTRRAAMRVAQRLGIHDEHHLDV